MMNTCKTAQIYRPMHSAFALKAATPIMIMLIIITMMCWSAPLAAMHGPPLANIMEHADGAAHVHVLDSETYPGHRLDGMLVTVEVIQLLWGAPPETPLLVWTPQTACGHGFCDAEMIIGFKACGENRRTYLGLPPNVSLLCGAVHTAPGLAGQMKTLKTAKDWPSLLALFKNGHPPIRHQAFRALKALHLNGDQADPAILDALLSASETETDPQLMDEALAAFRKFRHRPAIQVIMRNLLSPAAGHSSPEAATAFQALARASDVAELAALYGVRSRRCQKRILRALAARTETEAVQLIDAAWRNRDNALAILDGLRSAGRPLPRRLAGRRTGLERRDIESWIRQTTRKRTIFIHGERTRQKP